MDRVFLKEGVVNCVGQLSSGELKELATELARKASGGLHISQRESLAHDCNV